MKTGIKITSYLFSEQIHQPIRHILFIFMGNIICFDSPTQWKETQWLDLMSQWNNIIFGIVILLI